MKQGIRASLVVFTFLCLMVMTVSSASSFDPDCSRNPNIGKFQILASANPDPVYAGSTTWISLKVMYLVPPKGKYECSPGSRTSCTNTGTSPLSVPAQWAEIDFRTNEFFYRISTDKNGSALQSYTPHEAGEQTVEITVVGWTFGSNDELSLWGIDGNYHDHPFSQYCNYARVLTTISVSPSGYGTRTGPSDFAVVMEKSPSRIYPDQVAPVVIGVYHNGSPDAGRRVDLISDGGTLEPSSGLTNASGMFAANFSSHYPGRFTIQAKSERMMEKLNDSRMVEVEVLPPPPVYEAILPSFYTFITAIPGSITSILQQKPPQVLQNSGDGITDTGKIPGNAMTDGEMQVVALQQTMEPANAISHNPGVIPPAITPAPANAPAIVEVQMIGTPAGTLTGTPSPTLLPVVPMSIPPTQIAYRPKTVSPATIPCPEGYTRCDGICFDLARGTSHCGSCNTTCPSGSACVSGLCTPQCGSGMTACNGACTNLLTDTQNCGSCGHACLSGATCTNGQCVAQMATTRPSLAIITRSRL
jgi:hypothetical protein